MQENNEQLLKTIVVRKEKKPMTSKGLKLILMSIITFCLVIIVVELLILITMV